MNAEEIKKAVENLPTEEGIAALTKIIEENPVAEEAYIQRGMRNWSLNRRGAAITDYLSAIRLNPDSQAKMLLDNANRILDYYNKDLYNP